MKSANHATSAQPMRRVIPFRNAHERRGEELAFLPAALEIVETPPSPIGRTIGATIILLFCAALVWAWWGTIDIVASATGKILPSGRTKVIQPFETGVVRSIRVQDGQAVKAGDVLIELDPTVNAAERDHLRNDLLAEQLNIARLRAALAGADGSVADFTPPADADPVLISTQRPAICLPRTPVNSPDRTVAVYVTACPNTDGFGTYAMPLMTVLRPSVVTEENARTV
jgi:hemolysin D